MNRVNKGLESSKLTPKNYAPPRYGRLLAEFTSVEPEFIADAVHDARQLCELRAPEHVRADPRKRRAWEHTVAFRKLCKVKKARERYAPLEACGSMAAPDGNAYDAKDELEYLLSLLTPILREAFLLHKRDGYSFEEIAAMKGEKAETVKKRYMRAVERMREEREKNT